jgi:tRNA uridine 5-carboxymethylaminomethyl modification enzyme
MILDRSESYMGVMVDDLVLQGVTEPYRMLTARAEYRLRLRADNAATRLTPNGIAIGLVQAATAALFAARQAERKSAEALLAAPVASADYAMIGMAIPGDGAQRTRVELLRFPEVNIATLRMLAPELEGIDDNILSELAEDAHYAPYIARQEAELRSLAANEAIILDRALDYGAIGGLSREMVERLSKARPETLGQAARIDGVTPAALTAILVHGRRRAA